MKAWVIFSGQADLWWLKALKPGFRHCAVVLHDGTHWINIDPLSHTMEVNVSPVPASFNLPLLLGQQGHRVVATELTLKNTPAPWGILTCVGVTKRVLGLRRRFIVTPWQLYRHLIKEQHKQTPNTGEPKTWEV